MMNTAITGKRVLITGAGGSIGSELARQALLLRPKALTLLDVNENSLYLLTRSLEPIAADIPVTPEVISIRDRAAIDRLFQDIRPETVLHAAAHKHVPLMERNPDQAVKNNIFGTKNLIDAAEQTRAERFVLISTDKAVRPTSVMGGSKRICEQLIAAKGKSAESGTLFTAVRFGNVLDSAGSVLPLFRQQILSGGPVRLTDKRMTRYFMSIPEAAALVLSAAERQERGKLYMLSMGSEVSILSLAEQMIKELARDPASIPIIETGLRPGEKLHEELSLPDEHFTPVGEKLLAADLLPAYTPEKLSALLDGLHTAAETGDGKKIRELLFG